MNRLLINLSFLFDQPTGLSVYASNIVPYLKRLNPNLLVSKNNPEYSCYQIPDNLTPKQGKKGHFRRLIWTQFQLPKIYEQLSAKLLFSPVPEMPLYSKCNSVIVVHDLIPLRFPNFKSPLTLYFRHYLPWILNQASHIICNSVATAQDIQDYFNIPESKITPILLGYNREHFQPLKKENKQNNIPYFLYYGRHDSYKNLSRIIQAFAVISNHQDCQLWIAGSQDQRYTPQLKLQTQELNIADQVKFLDYVSYQELPQIINGAIALLFPSLWEGFGFPVLESMGCGIPVITSNISSLPEVVGDAAILVDPYNIGEIMDAMKVLMSDSNLRKNLSQKGLQQANKFSWEKTGQQTAKILEKYL
jgi:glycosyltransferase involved in cell wall biosynthesis